MVVWSLLKTNCLNGVVKAVCIHESSESSIYENPQLASSLLNTCAPASCRRVSSTLGNGWTFLRTLSLRDQKSTQLRTAPDLTPRKLKYKHKHLRKIHVWAGISKQGATHLVMLSGTMTAAKHGD